MKLPARMTRLVLMVESPKHGAPHVPAAVYAYTLFTSASEFAGQWRRSWVASYASVEEATRLWPEALLEGQQTDPIGRRWRHPTGRKANRGSFSQLWAEDKAFCRMLNALQSRSEAECDFERSQL